MPTSKTCSGNIPQTCDSNGSWQSGSACSYVCSGAGNCTGSCVPTSKTCSGNVPQTCDSTGTWQGNSPCQYVCSGAGNCTSGTGGCIPSQKRCNGFGAETCDATGQWQLTTTCSFQCSAGSCTGVCTPGSRQCNVNTAQTCDSNGAWQNSQSCPFVCDSGTGQCGGVCISGTQQCSGSQIQTCGINGQWAAASNCPAVPGASDVCDSGTNTCKATCAGSHFDCNNNIADGCEVDASNDANNCGVCGHSCCGGTCGGGTCNVYDTEISAGFGLYDVDANNLYWVASSAVNQQPRLGGAVSTLVDASASSTATTINSIVSDGTTLYWSQSNGGIFSVAIAGTGTSSLMYGNTNGNFTVQSSRGVITTFDVTETGTLALDATHLFWSGYKNFTEATITWKPRSNPNATATLITVPARAASIMFTSDDTNVYVISPGSSTASHEGMYRADIASGTGADWITLSDNNEGFGGVVTDKTNVYYTFANSNTISETGIWKKPVAGGAPVQLVAGASIGSLATDGAYVYSSLNSAGSPMKIKKVSVNGGAAQIVTVAIALSLKVVNSCLYWQDGGGIQSTIKSIAVSP